MPFAILQKDLRPPAREQLLRAFRALPELTDADAGTLARDAYGIIVRGLTQENARILHGALLAEGAQTVVVDQRLLPSPPPPRRVLRGAPGEEGFAFSDLYGRLSLVLWENVHLVAAGRISVPRDRPTRGFRIEAVPGPRGSVSHVVKRERDERPLFEEHLLLDILSDAPPARHRIEGGRFQYDCLGARRLSTPAANFSLLALDVICRARRATLNVGASAFLDDPRTTHGYPSAQTFEEEIQWLLWRRGPGRDV